MTKKHFIALADAIVSGTKTGVPFDERHIMQLADFCEAQNPNFNRSRWVDYVHGKCGKNGGKVKQEVA